MSINNRNQLQSVVDKSVDIGLRREIVFQKHLLKNNIEISKKENMSKHYDFYLNNNKNIKIEVKSSNNSVDTYSNVLLGLDKIIYFLYRYTKNPKIRFFVVYGFYSTDIENKKRVKYLYSEIDILKVLKDYKPRTVSYKKHIFIPISTLKPINELIAILQNINDYSTIIEE